MKRILQFIGILIFMIGCNSEGDELQNLWIGKYIVHDPNTENESFSNAPRNIFKFDKDSLKVKRFYSDFSTDTNDINGVEYQLKDEMILLKTEGKFDTFNIEISLDSLAIIYDLDYPRKIVYSRLSKYNLANRESEFQKLLLSSSYNIFDSVRIEFQDNASLIIPNFDFNVGDDQLWMIDKYKEELFLVVDGFFGFVLHIKEINTEGFVGIIYGKVNKEIEFKKADQETKFEINELIGEWIEFKPKNLLPPPPIFNEEKEFYEKEQLLITDSTIQRSHFFKVETIKWNSNREKDLILLPEFDFQTKRKKWKIVLLTDKELILDRILKKNYNKVSSIERTKFVRK